MKIHLNLLLRNYFLENMMDKILDCHSHMLPMMDDGSSSIKESIQMLKESYNQGVTDVVLTSHFYPGDEKIEDFLNRRHASLDVLLNETKTLDNIPNLYLGAEVAYYYGISNSSSIKECVFNGTNYFLLEMPFEKWDNSVVEDVIQLKKKFHLNVIIAHFERFLSYGNKKHIKRLFDYGFILQSNCEFFIKKETRREALAYLKKGLIGLIGTDSHNMKHRKPNMKECLDIINQKHSKYLDKVLENSNLLINSLEACSYANS